MWACTGDMLTSAGFLADDLSRLQNKLLAYAEGTKAERIVSALLSGDSAYHCTDQTFPLSIPRLKQIDKTSQLATFIFSGTAPLSPELADSPDVTVLPQAAFEESYTKT